MPWMPKIEFCIKHLRIQKWQQVHDGNLICVTEEILAYSKAKHKYLIPNCKRILNRYILHE